MTLHHKKTDFEQQQNNIRLDDNERHHVIMTFKNPYARHRKRKD